MVTFSASSMSLRVIAASVALGVAVVLWSQSPSYSLLYGNLGEGGAQEVRDALHRLEPLWSELFPAEQARIIRALVERVVVGPEGADIRLRVEGLAGLVQELGAMATVAQRAA